MNSHADDAVRTRLITMACDNRELGVRSGVRMPTSIGMAGWLVIGSYILTAPSINCP